MLGLEADEEHEVAVVTDAVDQVMEDAARLGHPARRHDHGRPAHLVQRLRFLHVAHVPHQREVEQLRAAGDQLFPLVEDLGVQPEDGRRAHRERAVDEDRHLGNVAETPELVQRVDDLLRPPEGE